MHENAPLAMSADSFRPLPDPALRLAKLIHFVRRWRAICRVIMKIVMVSDIHANLAALEALPEREYDQPLVLG